MANKRVTDLTENTSPQDTDVLYLARTGADFKLALATLKDYCISALSATVSRYPGPQSTGYTATASGTYVDILVPSWAKKFDININGMSTSGTSGLIIQLGVAIGIPTTSGYYSSASSETGGVYGITNNGFSLFYSPAASQFVDGIATINKGSGGRYYYAAQIGDHSTSNATMIKHSTGINNLGSDAVMLRITTAGGTDTFDGGGFEVTFY